MATGCPTARPPPAFHTRVSLVLRCATHPAAPDAVRKAAGSTGWGSHHHRPHTGHHSSPTCQGWGQEQQYLAAVCCKGSSGCLADQQAHQLRMGGTQHVLPFTGQHTPPCWLLGGTTAHHIGALYEPGIADVAQRLPASQDVLKFTGSHSTTCSSSSNAQLRYPSMTARRGAEAGLLH